MKKKAFLSVLSVIFIVAATPAGAASFETISIPAAEEAAPVDAFTAPLILTLSNNSFSGEAVSGAKLNAIQPAAGNALENIGGIQLGVIEEKGKDNKEVFKLELSYSPAENVKVRTKRGGLMVFKKFVFAPEPQRATLSKGIQAAAPAFE